MWLSTIKRKDAARRVFEPEPHRLGDARRDGPARG
jgi:hypothetical protein